MSKKHSDEQHESARRHPQADHHVHDQKHSQDDSKPHARQTPSPAHPHGHHSKHHAH